MKGAIAGDIIGSHYEFLPCKEKGFLLFGDYYYFTDDTILTLAISESLLNIKDYEKSLVKWSRKYPNMSWGVRYNVWFRVDKQEPYNSYGNGSAMRVSPVGWAFDTLEETLEEAKKSAEVTHNHPEGVKGAQAVAAAIFMARNKSSKETIKKYIENTFEYDLSRKYVDIQSDYSHVESCQESVPEALICFLESTDFEDAIRNAVALGGDADTQACIAGAIAEAFYGGVPDEIWKTCEKELEPEMITLINKFYEKYDTNFKNNVLKEENTSMYSFTKDNYYDSATITKQYADRIGFLMKSDKTEEQKSLEKEKLVSNSTFDPRRREFYYGSEKVAQKNRKIAERLDAISKGSKDNFLTHGYVLSWSENKPTTWVRTFNTDITLLAVDAIVNAASSSLLGGGGVDGAIHRAAGNKLKEECEKIIEQRYPDGLPTGEAVITKGYNLPTKHVIHTVGPIWKDGKHGEPELLYKCYFNSLLVAKDNKIESIAFPEISTGAYGYPKELARKVVLKAINEFVEKYPSGVEEILLIITGDDDNIQYGDPNAIDVKFGLSNSPENTNDFVQKVLDIINSSDRKMPAHFTSNGSRTQSFCVDFDISEVDEYAMASEAWYSATDPATLMTGEDVMLSAYIATLLGGEEYVPELYQIIIDINASEITHEHEEYFKHCAEFGSRQAKGSKG